MFTKHSRLGSITADYNYQNAVWRLHYSRPLQKATLPTFAAMLADRSETQLRPFLIDYSLDPQSVPTVSAGAVAAGNFDPNSVRGKDVVIGGTTEVLGDMYFIPGTGQMGGAYIQIMAAETLKSSTPVELGWIPLFLTAIGVAALMFWRQGDRHQLLLIAGAAAIVLLSPALLESRLNSLDVTPALFVLITAAAVVLRRGFRNRGLGRRGVGIAELERAQGDARRPRQGADRGILPRHGFWRCSELSDMVGEHLHARIARIDARLHCFFHQLGRRAFRV